MSMTKPDNAFSIAKAAVIDAKKYFIAVIEDENIYNREAAFATNIIKEGLSGKSMSYWASAINSDYGQNSIRDAVANVARTGISLSPVKKEAYLVPRGGKVCLDISYRGLINLAVKDNAILACVVDIVCKDDSFKFSKVSKEPPVHEYNPFVNRDEKNIIGAYCSALLPSGYWMTEVVSMADINKAKAASSGGVWSSWFGEMCKKFVIKRASKMWATGREETRLGQAIEYLNVEGEEGIDQTEAKHKTAQKATKALESLPVNAGIKSLEEEPVEQVKIIKEDMDLYLAEYGSYPEMQVSK